MSQPTPEQVYTNLIYSCLHVSLGNRPCRECFIKAIGDAEKRGWEAAREACKIIRKHFSPVPPSEAEIEYSLEHGTDHENRIMLMRQIVASGSLNVVQQRAIEWALGQIQGAPPSEAMGLADRLQKARTGNFLPVDAATGLLAAEDMLRRLSKENAELRIDSSNYRSKCEVCNTANMDMLTDDHCERCEIERLRADLEAALQVLAEHDLGLPGMLLPLKKDVEIERLRAELDKWRPLTNEEAQKAYDEAEAMPLSEERIQEIVTFALDPANRCDNGQQAQMVGEIRRLRTAHAAMVERLEAMKPAATTILAAIREVEMPPHTPCKHCDLEVGFLCPMCGLLSYSGDMARSILAESVPQVASENPQEKTK